jgi:sigma-B regulation protein RsbU (phosphoserine phosphatase)
MKTEKVTARKRIEGAIRRYEQRLRNLKSCFEVSTLINSSLEMEEVLDQIMSTSRAVMGADACSLMLVDEASQELVFQVAQGAVGKKLREGFRIKRGQGIAGHVFETGEPLLIEDAYSDPRFNPEFDRRTGYRTRSILCVPLKVKERIIGVSQILNKDDNAPFTSEDLETFSLLNVQAAIAIENARIHRALLRKQQIESDLAFATEVQRSFLPEVLPEVPGYRFIAHYQSALAVGGDFYDFIPLPDNRLGILIGDVSGKGVSSALYMAKLTSDFRIRALRQRGAANVVEQINDLLCDRARMGMFVTLLYMVLNIPKQTVNYVNAGHLPPLLWNKGTRRFGVLGRKAGPPLGIIPGLKYSSGRLRLNKGDCLALVTDGLIDARNPAGRHFGWERLEEAVRAGESNAQSVLTRLTGTLKRFVRGASQSDDTTLVLLGVESQT